MNSIESGSDSVTLHLTAHRDPELLRVEFAVYNGGDEPVFVYSVPVDRAARELRPGDAYRDVDPDSGTLLLSLIPPSPPVGLDAFQSVAPLARRVAPSETFRSTLRVALPLTPWDGYPPIDPDDDPPSDDPPSDDPGAAPADGSDAAFLAGLQVRRVRLTTGYFPESGLIESRPGPDPETFWCDGTSFRRRTAEIELDEALPVQI